MAGISSISSTMGQPSNVAGVGHAYMNQYPSMATEHSPMTAASSAAAYHCK